MLGRTIQNYRVEELLGEGGMGTVYKASDIVLRRPVALKMLHPHLVRDTTFMERFRNEAILSAQLNHPNVTTLYNFLQDHTDSVIVMELVHGITVEKFLKQNGQLPLESAVRIVIQTLDGVQHAHSRGILHRDIKAANLMLTPEGSVKLMDFGIARLEGSTRLTRADRVVGTLEYMAPELLNGAEPSVQSDLYAIGILLYELLCGKMPFESSTDITLISQILTKKPISLRSRIPNLPQSIENILDRLLQKNPDKRYHSALELRNALTAIVPAGNLDARLSNTTPKLVPATRIADKHASKPPVNPTRLAEVENLEKPSIWVNFRNNLWSLEGKILLGAILFAMAVLSLWSYSGPATIKSEKDTTLVERVTHKPDTISKEKPEPKNISEQSGTALFQEEAAQKPLEEIPSENTPEPVRKRKKTVIPKPVAETPVQPVEEKKQPEKAVRKTMIELKGETFSAELSQPISTESSYAGQTIWLRATSSVQVEGVTVIREGARVRGKIEKVNSKADHSRAGLWFHFEAAEATDGQWVPVTYKWDDTAFHALELKQGMVFRKIRTVKSTVSLSL
jgi:eukaryotic-like serine/threonine-protein kinase